MQTMQTVYILTSRRVLLDNIQFEGRPTYSGKRLRN